MCIKNKHFDKRNYSIKYINWYIGLNSSAEMQELKLFPNAKEIQESAGLLNTILGFIGEKDSNINKDNPNIGAYVIGDGVRPRTAGLFSFITKWKCWSIDPLMRVEEDFSRIKRLTVIKANGEDVIKSIVETNDYVLLVFPHSHIPDTNKIYKEFKDQKVWIINMPCCYQSQDIHLPFTRYATIVDSNINSDKNHIKIYCNYMNIV